MRVLKYYVENKKHSDGANLRWTLFEERETV